jgi:tRNA (guanosine-2'-O-)-methyltransferase
LTPQREEKLRNVAARRYFDLTVLLENVHDPHNVSAILRTCDAIGMAEVHVVNTILPWHRKGHKSSASAKQWVKVNFYRELEPCIEKLRVEGFSLWGTHLGSEAKDLFSLDLTQKIALVFGNEHTGISKELLAYCDGNFIIPMNGMLPSLNVSVSAAISLYEAFRQRRSTDLLSLESNRKSQEALLKEWEENEWRRGRK